MDNNEFIKHIRETIEKEFHKQGVFIHDTKWINTNRGSTLRIFIDSDKTPVTLDMCGDVSRFAFEVLDGDNSLSGEYNLEVSSPGLYRELKRDKDFIRFTGSVIKLKTLEPVNGQKVFRGKIIEYCDGAVKIDAGGACKQFSRAECKWIRLDPEIFSDSFKRHRRRK